MAYHLENTGFGDVAVSISPITLSSVGDYLTFSGFAESGNTNGEYRLAGEAAGYDNIISMTTTEVSIRGGGTFADSSANYLQPAAGQDFVLRIEKTGATEWTATLDQGTPVVLSGSFASMTIDQFMRLATGAAEAFIGGLYYIEHGNSGGVVSYWDANASGGTGTTLPDTVGTNDGTLVGAWPGDNTQWAGSAPAASITIDQAAIEPNGTLSGSFANYATIPTTLTVSDGTNTITIVGPTITDNGDGTGTFSGTMPDLPGSGTADLILFGTATVELS